MKCLFAVDFQYLPCHWKQDCVINDTPIKHSCHRSVLFKAIHNPKFFFFPKSNWCQVRLAKVSFQKFFLIPCTHLPQGCCLSGRSVSKQIWLHNIETYTSVQLGQFLRHLLFILFHSTLSWLTHDQLDTITASSPARIFCWGNLSLWILQWLAVKVQICFGKSVTNSCQSPQALMTRDDS